MYNNKNMKLVAGILLLLTGTGVVFTTPVAAIEQVVQKGTTGVIHTGKGNINITGYSIEQHENKLKEQEHSIRKELEKLYKSESKNLSLEKQLLERNLADVTNQIQSLKDSYQKQIAFLESTITELRALTDAGNDSQVTAAISA